MSQDRKEWALQILKKTDPFFRPPWATYDHRIQTVLTPQTVWIDGGSGDNSSIRTHAHLARIAIGVDMICPQEPLKNFVKADISNLPFQAECADLATLCFVVEHFQDLKRPLLEISRMLKKKGKLIILTTNSLSPVIWLPRILLPFPLRRKILAKYWGTPRERVFTTSHRLIGPRVFKTLGNHLHLNRVEFFSDLNDRRKWIFIAELLWHLLTRLKPLEKFRSTLLISLEKDPGDKG